MDSRAHLLERLAALEAGRLLTELQDQSIINTPENNRAQILRNGLMVVGFAALEDFVRHRTAEVLGEISRGSTGFADLPRSLQTAATQGALLSLRHLTTVWRGAGEDAIANIQSLATEVASTGKAAYSLSKYSFGHMSSNVGDGEVSAIMSSLLISHGWKGIDNIGMRCGRGLPSYQQQYAAMTKKRHSAAHSSGAQTTSGDLEAFVAFATGFAAAFDCVVSYAGGLFRRREAAILQGSALNVDTLLHLRFVREAPTGGYREEVEGQARAVRVRTGLDESLRSALSNAARQREAVIIQDSKRQVIDWRTIPLL